MTDIPENDAGIKEKAKTKMDEHLLIRDLDTGEIIVNQKEVQQILENDNAR